MESLIKSSLKQRHKDDVRYQINEIHDKASGEGAETANLIIGKGTRLT